MATNQEAYFASFNQALRDSVNEYYAQALNGSSVSQQEAVRYTAGNQLDAGADSQSLTVEASAGMDAHNSDTESIHSETGSNDITFHNELE